MEKNRTPYIQSLQRAVDILNCFTEKEPTLTLPQISQKVNLHINTTRGLVNTLVHYNLMSHNPLTNSYSLGLYFISKINLIRHTWSMNYIEEISLSIMKKLADKYTLFSGLQIVKDNKIFTIKAVQPGQLHYRIAPELYTPLELHCTASGKLFLQYLSPVQQYTELEAMTFQPHTSNTISSKEQLLNILHHQEETIYATEFDELDTGIGSIAAPILTSEQKLFGTISVIAPSQVLKTKQPEICTDLLEASQKISHHLSLIATNIL